MTAPDISFATTGRNGVKQASALLVEAARRGDLMCRRERRWPVYLVNGVERPEIRPLLSKLLEDGVLVVVDPDAAESLVLPAGGVR